MSSFSLALAFIFAAPQLKDPDFNFAVEEFVMSASPKKNAPEPIATLLACLGSPTYSYRQAASKKLSRWCEPPNERWLYWAIKSRDAEVRMRADSLLHRFYRCKECFGTGDCTAFVEGGAMGEFGRKCLRCWKPKYEHIFYTEPYNCCSYCQGTGSIWMRR